MYWLCHVCKGIDCVMCAKVLTVSRMCKGIDCVSYVCKGIDCVSCVCKGNIVKSEPHLVLYTIVWILYSRFPGAMMWKNRCEQQNGRVVLFYGCCFHKSSSARKHGASYYNAAKLLSVKVRRIPLHCPCMHPETGLEKVGNTSELKGELQGGGSVCPVDKSEMKNK